MKGRYLIYTPVESVRDEKRFDTAWRKFAEVCRSLNRDGLTYTVDFRLTDARPSVIHYGFRYCQTAQADRPSCDTTPASGCATL